MRKRYVPEIAIGVCPSCKGRIYGLWKSKKRDVFRSMGCPHCPPVIEDKRKVRPIRKFRLIPTTRRL